MTTGQLSNLDLTWTAHPARQRPGAAAGALAVIAAIAAAAFVSFGPIWAVGCAIIMLGALNRFFLPSTFAIDAQGITARYPLRRQRMLWRQLRRFVHDQRGGYLSTRFKPSRMDAYRGMHLLFEGERQRIIAQIQKCMLEAQVRGQRSEVSSAGSSAAASAPTAPADDKRPGALASSCGGGQSWAG